MKAAPGVKRKRVVLTIKDKLAICDALKNQTSTAVQLASKYNVGTSTISDIRKSEAKLRSFLMEKSQIGVKDVEMKAKCLKTSQYEQLDQALYIWFRQLREKNVPVTGPVLLEKASAFHQRLYPEAEKDFVASTGYQTKFCRRFGIRNLAISGEKVSADVTAAEEYIRGFASVADEYSRDQIFNADETGLCFRLLPSRTLTAALDKNPIGMKKPKDRVTISACANASGTIKLPLLFIGKAKRPRCFAGINMQNLPVTYRNSKNAWVTREIFGDWFHNIFVPFVHTALNEMEIEPKAILILDNCAAHPDEADLVSPDGKIRAAFLPANVTSLVQPMDQGVLENMKRNYRKQLLRDLINQENADMIPFLRAINMKDVVDRSVIAWDSVTEETLRRSWKKLLPEEENNLDGYDSTIDISATDEVLLTGLTEIAGECSTADLKEWFDSDGLGYEHLDDEGIAQHVQCQETDSDSDDEDDVIVVQERSVTHAEACHHIDQFLNYLRSEGLADPVNTATCLRWLNMAAERPAGAMKQTSILSFLK